MTNVGLFVHGGHVDAIRLAVDLQRWLADRGHGLIVASAEEKALLEAASGQPVTAGVEGAAIDLVVAVGGDGTMLRATRHAVAADADVLGINLGQLGYLAEVEPDGWQQALEDYLAGRHQIAERLVTSSQVGGVGVEPAQARVHLPPGLNEVVIEKQAMGRTVRLGVAIDHEFFHSYTADGVIIATPTGSTAYSLSARGPVVDPTHRALILTAVSPHSLFDRSLVLEPSSTIEVEVLGDRPAGVAVDGQHIRVLPPGAKVTVTADARPARFVTFGGRDFHRILKAKFGLSDR